MTRTLEIESRERERPAPAAPTVSVIMPVYNAGRYLIDAVRSIRDQTYKDWELILIDDGSTDGSVDSLPYLNDPRVVLLRQSNRGKPAAMNRALEHVRGEFYASQDADDLSFPERLEKQVAFLRAHPAVAGVLTGSELILDGKHVAPTFRAKSEADCAKSIARGDLPAHDPTAMYRMSFVRNIRYAEDLPTVEGVDYILRVGEQFPLAVLGECLYSYRWHFDSVTKRESGRRDRALEVAFDRMAARRGVEPDRWQATRRQDFIDELSGHLSTSVADQVAAGRRLDAIRTGVIAVTHCTSRIYRWKPLAYALTPWPFLRLYFKVRECLQT
jgi:glycosyltransferase involved in cell wall biosynthesis